MRVLMLIPFLFIASFQIVAQPVPRDDLGTGAETGLALPRFVAIRAGEANLRTGPGERYPILWRYQRRGYPLKVIAERGAWRRVQDRDGTTGWMFRGLLTNDRHVLVSAANTIDLRARPGGDSTPILRAEPDVVARLLRCRDGWCRVKLDDRRGWAPIDHFWGVFTDDDGR